MRTSKTSGDLTVRLVAGTQNVLFAMNLKAPARKGLLGFAIGEVQNGKVTWLTGSKVFPSVVPKPDPKDKFPSDQHPVQSFIWSDFVAQPGTTIHYRVAPVYGPVNKPKLGDHVDIDAQTVDPTKGTHGVYFNRGAIASQAFAEHFGSQAPKDQDDPKDETVVWLARGMLDASLAYIAAAKPGDRLLVAAYEFTYTPVLQALKDAAAKGVGVEIVYEAGQEKDKKTKELVNTSATNSAAKAIQALGLKNQSGLKLIKRTKRRNIPHNKFMVLERDGKAIEVATGSVNYTASGYIGQTNVLHIIRDADVAEKYKGYWEELSGDPPTTDLSAWSKKQVLESGLDELTKPKGIVTFFSPRKNDSMLDWYAAQIGKATTTVMFTAAFGVSARLSVKFAEDQPFVRFLLLEDQPDKELSADLAKDRDVMFAYGSLLGAFAQGKKQFPPSTIDEWFLKEELFRKQGNIFFIHTKFLLVDPLGDDPLVCTGSANFSTSSLTGNDENMILIRGETDVADIYLTEFDRIFRHFFARQNINDRILEGKEITESKFLAEDDSWVDAYVKPGRTKTNRQRLFFPSWPN